MLFNIFLINFLINIIKLFNYKFNKNFSLLENMGIGDWGLGIGDWGLGPIPNPQSPFSFLSYLIIKLYLIFIYFYLKIIYP